VSEHMSDTKNFEVITAAAERLAVSPGRSYRTWSREEKDRIVGETFAPLSRARSSAVICVAAQGTGLGDSRAALWVAGPSGPVRAL
jgi:transposase